MDATYQQRLGLFSDATALNLLGGIRRGVEREALRYGADDRPAKSAHPDALGSALCHAHITTDFAEALLELVTPPAASIEALMRNLDEVHRVVAAALAADEYLWSASMPGRLDDEPIALADYGASNSGRMRRLYREGLARRYGWRMQTMAGAHYNFSMPEAFWPLYERSGRDARAIATDGYLAMLRNCRRHAWLPVYLFGASPLAPADFLVGREHKLTPNESGDYGMPWATSLRMSTLGYQSETQDELHISLNSLDEYAADMRRAIFSPHPSYEAIGARDESGYLQLNTSALQIENEHYGVARPKRSIGVRGVPPLAELLARGVEYVEFRALDIDPQALLGVRVETLRFMDAFLLSALLTDSPPLDAEEDAAALDNLRSAVLEGRRPGLQLRDGGKQRELKVWGLELLDAIGESARLLDAAAGVAVWSEACELQRRHLENPQLTPSASLLADVAAAGCSFAEMMARRSRECRDALRRRPPDGELAKRWARRADDSKREQRALEADDALSFDEYLAQWYRGYDL